MIPYLIQVVLCMAVFYAFYHVALRRETLFASNRAYLLITLLLSFILPLLSIYIEAQQASTIIEAPLYVASYVQTFSEGIVIRPQPKAFNWTLALWIAYGIVVLVLLLKMLASILVILRIHNRGERQIMAGEQCIVSGDIKCPFSFFNTIYMPRHHQFSEMEIAEVIAHEKTHVQGKHTWDVIGVELACILLWFNPFVYLYRKALKDLHEFMADAAVIESTPWDHYAELLIANKDNTFQSRLSHHLIFSQLKKRLLMMNKQRSGTTGKMKYLGILPILLIALILFSFREKHQVSKASEVTPLHLNKGIDPVLYITPDNRYFLDGKELAYEELANALKAATQDELEWKIAVVVDDLPKRTVGEIVDVLDIGQKQNIQMIIHTGAEWDAYMQSMRERIAKVSEVTPGEKKIYDLYEDGLKLQRLDPMTGTLSPFTAFDAKLDPLDTEQPIFPGCENLSKDEQQKCSTEKLYAYIAANLVYPESLKKSGIEGKVFVKFVVGADGFVKDISIQRSLQSDADETVLKLVKDMNMKAGKWQPAYKAGKAVDAEMILPVSFVTGKPSDVAPLTYAEEMPRIAGCEHLSDATERFTCSQGLLYKIIYENLKYPDEDKANNIEGHVIAQFTIAADGKMHDIKIVRTKSETMTAEVIRVLNIMAATAVWIPGKEKGQPVAVRYTVPVKFILEDSAVKDESSKPYNPAASTSDNEIIIHPNPATHTIKAKLPPGIKTVTIIDESGRQVLTQKVEAGQEEITISVSGLKPAKHYVHFVGDGKTVTGVFIKQ